MDSFELNKIFGAITGALVVFLGVTFLAEAIYKSGHGYHGEQTYAYAIALDEDEPVVEEVVEEPTLSFAAVIAGADAGNGERVFRRCASCHSIEAGGRNGVGPALWGIMGREIAATDGFRYSDALQGKDGVWDWEAMYAFVEAPDDWAPGTAMAFAGLRRSGDRADLLAYLNQQSDAPIEPPVE